MTEIQNDNIIDPLSFTDLLQLIDQENDSMNTVILIYKKHAMYIHNYYIYKIIESQQINQLHLNNYYISLKVIKSIQYFTNYYIQYKVQS